MRKFIRQNLKFLLVTAIIQTIAVSTAFAVDKYGFEMGPCVILKKGEYSDREPIVPAKKRTVIH